MDFIIVRIPSTSIYQVAKLAGVSPVTVSRVFSNTAPVAAATRKRVLDMAQQTGYQPNPLAAGLRGAKTNTIGMLWSLGGPHDSESMARRVTRRMQQLGYTTYLADQVEWKSTHKALHDFAQRRVDGVVIQDLTGVYNTFPQITRELAGFGAAVIVSAVPLDVPHDLIVQDRTMAMREAARHLINTGRTRPIAVAPTDSDRLKIDAFLQPWTEQGIQVAQDRVINVHHEDGAVAVETLFKVMDAAFGDEVPFDAAWCSSDEEAVGLIDWLRSRGKRVPEDVAVVGFNDDPMSAYLWPRLASVRRYDDQVVEQIEALLMQRLQQPALPPQRRYVEMKFVQRESAG